MARAENAKRVWQVVGAEKREAVQRMFGQIAPTYDVVNGLMSLSLHKRWRAIAVESLNLRHGDRALDVCCGTGDFLEPLIRKVGPAGLVFGLDFCGPMLECAHVKAPTVPLSLGDACRLPIQSASVEAVTVGWGIRNVPDIDAAHREILRVLKPGGRFVSIDMAKPGSPLLAAFSRTLFYTLVPLLGRLFGQPEAYSYLPRSTDSFFSREQLAESMTAAGFQDVRWRDLCLGNVCIHMGVRS